MAKQNYCIDCGTPISPTAKRCRPCATKARWARGDMDGLFDSEEYRRRQSESTKAAHARGAFDSKECLQKRSEGIKAAWKRGAYGEETRRKQSEAKKADWERGIYGDEEWCQEKSVAMKSAWQRGAFEGRDTSAGMKAAHARGDFGKEWRRNISEAKKADWANGTYDGVFDSEETRRKMSEASKAHWAQGCYDGVFQSPTSIEIQIAAALDIMGIEHQTQYRPEGYSRIYDEFIPPHTLIEVQGDYWHGPKRPENQKRDAQKAQWAAENGFELLVIWEHEIKERGARAIVAQAFA